MVPSDMCAVGIVVAESTDLTRSHRPSHHAFVEAKLPACFSPWPTAVDRGITRVSS